MSVDYITAQLKKFKLAAVESKKEADEFSHESPFLRTRREVQQELARAEKYRASILKNVTTFGGLSSEALITAAQSMEEIFYVKGEDIIVQDDIGDSFFVLEEGKVSVTRKANTRDYNEKPRELAQLGSNAHFGEIALLTAEPRSATVTVISDTAKCLRMTKSRFEELLATSNKVQAENRRIIGRDVLDKVALFRTLSAVNKKKILDVMTPMTYLPTSYICRQGTTGNSFFILTEGNCKVTINCDDKTEREVGRLRAGDFFGEIALMEATNRRTANVISIDSVSCLTLSRSDFNRLLSNLKVKLLEMQSSRGPNNTAGIKGASSDLLQTSSLANKRRISSYNTHGHRDENRINSLFKRFTKFTTEALWNSLYSRMYREMILDSSKQIEYGVVAETIMRDNDQRYPSVQAIRAQAMHILEMDPPRRSLADHAFIHGLLKQRNDVKDKLCKSWPAHQFGVLCKKIKFQKFIPFKKIFEIDSSGTAAYLIVRGCVRLYSKASSAGNDAHAPKAFFEQDIGPGEIFGEAALGGIHVRMQLAQAITHVDVIVIDDQDFMTAQDKDSNHMGTEERQKFLTSVSMFKDWDTYKLLRLAHVLIQEEVNKGVVLTNHGKPSKDLYFIVNGRVDLLTSLEKKYVITPLLKHDYIGESSIINKFIKASASKLNEEFYCVAVTKVEVLILPESAFTLFDLHSIDVIRSTFMAKMEWRRQRVKAMKYERAKMRKHMHFMNKECESLSEFPVDRTYLSEDQVVMIEEAHARTMKQQALMSAVSTFNSKSRPTSPGFDGQATALSRSGSPVRAGDSSRPGSPSRDDGAAAGDANIAPLILTTKSTQSKTRPQSAKVEGMAPIAVTNGKLNDIEDIPTIFIQDMDRFMVAISCRTERERSKFAASVSNALRPKSARVREIAVRAQCENTILAKRTAVLSVMDGKQSTKAKMIMAGRRDSAALTANALMLRDKDGHGGVRPHTAGALNGRRPLERDIADALQAIGSLDSGSAMEAGESFSMPDSRANYGPGHVFTHDIVQDARQMAMQSGDYESKAVGGKVRPATAHPPGSLPGIGHGTSDGRVGIADHTRDSMQDSTAQNIVRSLPQLNIPANTAASANTKTVSALLTTTTATATGTATSATHSTMEHTMTDEDVDGDNFDIDHNIKVNVVNEGESHSPFRAATPKQRRDSNYSTNSGGGGGESSKRSRKGSLSLRGSMCIPMSQSYADTLSKTCITPKSSMAMKLEATIEKYIHKR